jgi:hypothetical protein
VAFQLPAAEYGPGDDLAHMVGLDPDTAGVIVEVRCLVMMMIIIMMIMMMIIIMMIMMIQ